MTVGDPILRVRGLVKRFRQGRRTLLQRLSRASDTRRFVEAVRGVDFAAHEGEILAMLGPNGAGKSTTVRLISTLLEPTEGEISICGIDAVRRPDAAREHLGVVLGGERSVYWKLTARENLAYFAALQRVPRAETPTRIERALDDVGLSDRADDYVERFSTGMRQRLVVARALLGRPKLLLLDEPTANLDLQAASYLRERLRELREAGHAVVLATHDMAEAEQLADRVAIIDHGELIALDEPERLKRKVSSDRTLRAELRMARPGEHMDLLARMAAVARVREHVLTGDVLNVVLTSAPQSNPLPELIEAASATGAVVQSVENRDVTLADVFLELTGRGLRE